MINIIKDNVETLGHVTPLHCLIKECTDENIKITKEYVCQTRDAVVERLNSAEENLVGEGKIFTFGEIVALKKQFNKVKGAAETFISGKIYTPGEAPKSWAAGSPGKVPNGGSRIV